MTNHKMPDYSLLTPAFNTYLERWNTSPTAARVESVDGTAVSTGRAEQWTGVTIPDFILDILMDYTELLRKDPALLIDPNIKQEEFRKELQGFLADEQVLIEEADKLREKCLSYKFGRLDPRYHATEAKLEKVVAKFRLSGDDYHKHLPSFVNTQETW